MNLRYLPPVAFAALLAGAGAGMACTAVTADASGIHRHTALHVHGCATLDFFGRGAYGQVDATVASTRGRTRILAMGQGAGGFVHSAGATGDLTIALPMCPDGRPARPVHLHGASGVKVARCR